MKILELEIHNVRGITNLLLKPKGKNFVIWGPNGSGKSAVVDAIDFLLTGQISRLTGKGTGDITLSKHGPHIDYDPKDAMVRAKIQLHGLAESVELSRCLAHPSTLECEDKIKQNLEPIIDFACRGQHVLTRREILKYITAEASTRAEEIQELLNISEIEDIRRTLVKVQNDLKKGCKTSKRAVEKAKGSVNATVQAPTFSEEVVLKVVNESRTVLGGDPISILFSSNLKGGIKPPSVVPIKESVNIEMFERDVKNLQNVMLEENQQKIAKIDRELRTLLSIIRSDPKLLKALERRKLTKLGMKLIDETGSCPLCDKQWPPGELHDYLDKRLAKAKFAEEHQERISALSDSISGYISSAIASNQKVIEALQLFKMSKDFPRIQSWLEDLEKLSSLLVEVIEKYPDSRFNLEQVQRLLANDEILKDLDNIYSEVKDKSPTTSPVQTAWDILTRLEENLKVLEEAKLELETKELSHERAEVLLQSFQEARDTVLGRLYEDIKVRFVDLYKQLHGEDEEKFTATIEPDGASLNFEVDFYGRGTHPPHALHSEGHQDSMGICLFLALTERLTAGLIDLVILDDVVMSVDADHRRDVCHLLKTSFPGRQFLITTHDKTWTNQLKSEGVVEPRSIIEFYNWHIDTGPQVNYEVEMWERIEQDLQKNDVPSASAKLRRGSEEFFSMVCDSLKAQVIFKLNGKWELGDWLPSAMGKYRKLLHFAKESANSWGDKERLEMLNEVESTSKSIFTRSQVEQWAVNTNIHYNNWSTFSPADFRPVVEAFQDLFGLFLCSKCGSMLYLSMKAKTPTTVRCNCGKVNWNLMKKEKKE